MKTMNDLGLARVLVGTCLALLTLNGANGAASSLSREPVRVAITIDDLPWVGASPAEGSAADGMLRIAAVLRAHGAPATGFVVCDSAGKNPDPVEAWVAWGYTVGNHTAGHADLNRTSVDEWLEGVRRCDRYLDEKFHDAYLPYLRYPLLHQGNSPEKRNIVRQAIDEIGLETAHVTVDTSEWILTQAHATAIRKGDARLRREIGEAFIRHIVDAIEHADAVARRKTGHRVPQVLLLHANSLVDDYLDELLLVLRSRGIDFVSLPEALSDPVFSTEDAYAGGKGLSWLYRMAPLSLEDVAWDDAQAEHIRTRFSNVLNEDAGAADEKDSISYARIDTSLGRDFRAVLERAGDSERLRSILIAHRGRTVAEAYFNGAGPSYPANLKSITKTLTSALIGIALKNGWIKDLDDPAGDYLPGIASEHPGKVDITIRQLLSMSSGIGAVDYGQLQQSDDWLEMVLRAPIRKDRIGTFSYDTPVLQLLTAILERSSGHSSESIADEALLKPLNADVAYWRTGPQGIAFGGNDAYMLPRDMLRFGQLFLDDGRVNGEQLLPAAFVHESTGFQLPTGSQWINHGTFRVTGYGYLWWLLDLAGHPVHAALGHGGQMILVSPEQELVVVVTSRWPGPSSVAHYKHVTRVLVEDIFPLFASRAEDSGP